MDFISKEDREEIAKMMVMSPQQMIDSINKATEELLTEVMYQRPFGFLQLIKRGLVDILTLTDANGEEYGAIFPYQNLYLAAARDSKTPKDYRIRFNEKTEMYECWTVNPDINTEGETVWIPEMIACLNIGQLLSCSFAGMGLDPCGEPKVAIYLEQVSCDFDHANIEMTNYVKEETDNEN